MRRGARGQGGVWINRYFSGTTPKAKNAIIGGGCATRVSAKRAHVSSHRARFACAAQVDILGQATYLPRVPILTMGSSTSATTRMAPRDLTEALTRLAALGIAAEKEEERALIFLPDAAGATRAETAAVDIMEAEDRTVSVSTAAVGSQRGGVMFGAGMPSGLNGSSCTQTAHKLYLTVTHLLQ